MYCFECCCKIVYWCLPWSDTRGKSFSRWLVVKLVDNKVSHSNLDMKRQHIVELCRHVVANEDLRWGCRVLWLLRYTITTGHPHHTRTNESNLTNINFSHLWTKLAAVMQKVRQYPTAKLETFWCLNMNMESKWWMGKNNKNYQILQKTWFENGRMCVKWKQNFGSYWNDIVQT